MNTEIEELKSTFSQEMKAIESSIVLDEVDKNDLNCTTDVNEWLETVKQIDIAAKNAVGTGPNDNRVPDIFKQFQYHLNFDYEIIRNACGYITAPVFKYLTKVEAPCSNVFNSMQELKDFLKDKTYLLYMVIVSIKAEQVGTIDNGMYTIITNRPLFGTPNIKYTFRGYILK